jgi:hypothetical protein
MCKGGGERGKLNGRMGFVTPEMKGKKRGWAG